MNKKDFSAYGDAQGIGLSVIPGPDPAAEPTFLWHGERWLSAKGNNQKCLAECAPATGDCAEPVSPAPGVGYRKGEGFMYWIPLEFDDSGSVPTVRPFAPFVDEYNLTLPSPGPFARKTDDPRALGAPTAPAVRTAQGPVV